MKKEEDKKIATLLEDLASLESYILDLFTFSPLPICFISPIGVVLEFSPAFEKISGYKFYEIVGESIENIFDSKHIKGLIEKILETGEVVGEEAILLSKSKKEVHVSIFARVRKDENNKIVGLFMGVFDMSKAKKIEQELQEKVSELERFQKLAVGRELKMIELKKALRKAKGDS